MITVTNIRNMHPTRYHYAFAIVRSLKKRIPYVTQLQALSPSPPHRYFTNIFACRKKENGIRLRLTIGIQKPFYTSYHRILSHKRPYVTSYA